MKTNTPIFRLRRHIELIQRLVSDRGWDGVDWDPIQLDLEALLRAVDIYLTGRGAYHSIANWVYENVASEIINTGTVSGRRGRGDGWPLARSAGRIAFDLFGEGPAKMWFADGSEFDLEARARWDEAQPHSKIFPEIEWRHHLHDDKAYRGKALIDERWIVSVLAGTGYSDVKEEVSYLDHPAIDDCESFEIRVYDSEGGVWTGKGTEVEHWFEQPPYGDVAGYLSADQVKRVMSILATTNKETSNADEA